MLLLVMVVMMRLLLLLLHLLVLVLEPLDGHRGSVLFGIVNIVTAVPVASRDGLAVYLNGA
jgi:hypothetical protein